MDSLFIAKTKCNYYSKFNYECDTKGTKELSQVARNGAKTHHEYNNDFLDSDKIANIYFTSNDDAKNRVRGLNEYKKINLNEMRRKNMQNDGFFNINQEVKKVILMLDVENDVVLMDSQMNSVDDHDNGVEVDDKFLIIDVIRIRI